MILPLLRWSVMRRERALATLRDFERLTGRSGYSDLPWDEVENRTGLTPEKLANMLRPTIAKLALRREVWIMLRELRRHALTLGLWREMRPAWRAAARKALQFDLL